VLDAVSFEAYDLDYNGELKDNNFTRVGGTIMALGLRGIPMITTANIVKLRQLWPSTAGFIDAAVRMVVANGYHGINIDFEPENGDPPTADDAKHFAQFIDDLAIRLHAASPALELTVDIASWSAFWDFKLLAATHVDRLLTMDTYCGNTTLFATRLEKAVNTIGVNKLGIGLETVNPNTGKPFTLEEMQARFALIKKYNIAEIDVCLFPPLFVFFCVPFCSTLSQCSAAINTVSQIWQEPIPALWVPLLKEWIASK